MKKSKKTLNQLINSVRAISMTKCNKCSVAVSAIWINGSLIHFTRYNVTAMTVIESRREEIKSLDNVTDERGERLLERWLSDRLCSCAATADVSRRTS